MNFNLLVIPTLLLALLLFRVGEILFFADVKLRGLLFFATFLIGLPGFMISFYYFHLYDDAKWFYEFRSFPFTELIASGAGLFVGFLAASVKSRKLVSRGFLITILCIGILIPYLKPIVVPLPASELSDDWTKGVCLQSTRSSCGAASAATVFKSFGIDLSERAIARECFTYRGGTENWYIARAFKRRGLDVNYRIEQEFPTDLRCPVIAGVIKNGSGHFIAILSYENGRFTTGDPLIGKREYEDDIIEKRFEFTGFFMEIGNR